MDNIQREKQVEIVRVDSAARRGVTDAVAVEEPMEIRVVFGADDARAMRSLSITMRTPGQDTELAAGFLFTESILSQPDQIRTIEARGVTAEGHDTGNIIRVDLQPDVTLDMSRLQRHFFSTSSCGVCGKASLEALAVEGLEALEDGDLQVDPTAIRSLPQQLRAGQPAFAATGGIHAAGLFDAQGNVTSVREDVGRHNAVDKLIGERFLAGKLPLHKSGMVISGRASFEIMQKALIAGTAMVVAVGAPSSLAVEMAERYNVTLIGFASAERFNVYAGVARVC